VKDMVPAASDGRGHAVCGLGLYSVQAGAAGTSCEGKPKRFSSVMRCGERRTTELSGEGGTPPELIMAERL